jgi:hypothetical protein
MQDMQPDNTNMPADPEGAMAKADLYKLANYSYKLFKMIDGQQQLDGWVQAKITKAADYIASVYHYMEYEMKFSEYGEKLENSDVYTESQKAEIRNKLMEAKEKVKELKKKTADKMSKKDMPVKEEKSSTGGEIDRSKKGVTKHKQNTDRFTDEPHTEPKSQAKSKSAAEKKGDQAADKAEEKEGKNWEKRFGKDSVTRVKDGKKVDEAFDEKSKTGDKFKTRTGVATKTDTGVKHTNTSHSDEEHTAPKSNAKSRSAADKAGDKAADKAQEKDTKAYEKKHPGTVTRVKDGKKVDEALKGGQKKLDTDNDDDIDEKDLANLRAKKKVKEATDEKCNHTAKGKKCPVHGMKECSGMYEAAKPDFLDINKNGNKKEPMTAAAADKKAGPKKGVNPFAKKDTKVKEAITKAKAKMEGSIQGGVWVSSPDKGVAPPQDIDGGSAPAPKKAKSPFPSRNDPKKAADAAATKPGTANPAMPSRNKETVKESADLDRMKQFLTRLNG